MCLRLNTSAGATSASITVQRAALFAGVAMSKAHVTGRANTWSGFYGYSDGTEEGTKCLTDVCYQM